MIAAGIVTLAVFTWQYRLALRYMWAPPLAALAGGRQRLHSAAYFAALVVLAIGVIAMLSVLLKF